MPRKASFILLSAVCSLLPIFALAQTATELQNQIDQQNAQIQALQVEIAKYQSQIDTLGKQKNTLQSTINTLTLTQKQLAARISVTEANIASANLKLKQLGVAIGDKEEIIANNKSAIGKALRIVAENESDPLIARILVTDTLTGAWQTADALQQFNRALEQNTHTLKVARQELTINRDEVTSTKEKLLSAQKDLTVQKKSVDLNKMAQQKLLVDTKNEESTYQKLLALKHAEEKNFEVTLFELQSKLEYVLDPSKVPPAGKGVLRWPLDSVFITQQFGQTSSSGRLYTSGTHNGVDFRAQIGTPVRASLTGTVFETNAGAVQNCQYGKWILMKHGNGLATLYAHLSDISVAKGSVVAMGQVIGYSGNTGYATGPHLHMGVFYADALSFKQYVCKSGASVTIPIAPIRAYLDPLVYL